MLWRWTGLFVVLAVGSVVAFLNVRSSSPEQNYFSLEAEAFRATEARSIQTGSSKEHSFLTNIEFEPPHSWKADCPDQPYCSTIVVLADAWHLQGETWQRIDAPYVFISEGLTILGWAESELRPGGAGPTHYAEETTRLEARFGDYGDMRSEHQQANERGEPAFTYRDAGLTIEVVRGDETHRVYEATIHVAGPYINDRTVITFEYDVDVDVQPPLTNAIQR